ncbi:hypothetical protein MUN88_20335 [Gracilibacillus caseinilyticus]|uniref:Uncharacterized protein n=1 Tax=Gracilibacillus caseinilyticus TaxID=2932256 RepID=A0ABY4EVC7_9BACI|nr:hypothetical protein [Gracilibacillus caseinilyticus]UOQ48355.1 hypothetical protein MUN88_20335 [Gracilibacillus caseinilyticus]
MADVIKVNYLTRQGQPLPISTNSLALEIVAHVKGFEISAAAAYLGLALNVKFGQETVENYLERAAETHSGAYDNDRNFYDFLDSVGVDAVLF